MPIKLVSPDAIHQAMRDFDENWRHSKEYAGWINNHNYLHGISNGGKLYPPKKVISMATGMPLASFHGGQPSNAYLTALGFEIVPLRPQGAPAAGPFDAEMEIIDSRESVEDFDPKDQADGRERILRAVVQRRGQAKFRKGLIEAYEGQCAITGCEVLAILEAAHITPYLGPSTNAISNGLLLRADIHTLWDIGLVAVNPVDFSVWVSPSISDSTYRSYHGRKIKAPKSPADSSSLSALRIQWSLVLGQNEYLLDAVSRSVSEAHEA